MAHDAPAIEAALEAAPVEALAEFDRNLRAVEGIDRESYLKGFVGLHESGQSMGERPLMILTAGRPEATLASRQKLRAEADTLSSDVVRESADTTAPNESMPLDPCFGVTSVLFSERQRKARSILPTWLLPLAPE